MSRRRALAVLGPIGIAVLVALAMGGHRSDAGASPNARAGEDLPLRQIKHDKSPPLRSIPPKQNAKQRKIRKEHRFIRPVGGVQPDTAVQSVDVPLGTPTQKTSFQGITSDGTSLPPDPNSAVGPNHVVEVVNTRFQVFSKAGASLLGPIDTNTIWTGFGGQCETFNDGDATIAYDRIANRWVIQQFAFDPVTLNPPYSDCVAVSATGDPTGAWNRYEFGGFKNNFPDYPKLGVWPDAYYVTFNLFEFAFSYVGVQVCALDRAKMIAGQNAGSACKTINDVDLNGLLPSDLDGGTLPPGGSPNYLLGLEGAGIRFYTAKPNFAPSPPVLTLSAGADVAGVAPFKMACGGLNCIPQPNVSDQLDSLGDRLMYRLAYRNIGGHESLVATHSVKVDGGGGVTAMRWYEIRNPASSPSVFQQGTFAPSDGKYRWMGSAAMDKNGDIALGYSISNGSNLFPSLVYTGRLVGDPLGQMTQGETLMKAGAGSQESDANCSPFDCSLRWGDYSSMSIDPADDCTFWYTGEFLPNTGNFNWSTWIGSFTLPGCGSGGGGGGDDFSIHANPASVTIARGTTGKTFIQTAVTGGSAQSVNLTATGVPAKVAVVFKPTPVTVGTPSKLKFTVDSKAAKGTYTVTVTAAGSSATHATTVSLKIK